VILLVLVVILWLLVLAPSLYRRFSERDSVGSIDHFHHQLNLLEHAGPKLVSPAYRLHSAVPGGSVDRAAEADPPMYRGKLVLLRPVDDEEHADIDDLEGAHYERVGVLDPPEPPTLLDQSRVEVQAYRRQQARRRCSSILLVLAGLTVTTGILGMLPGLAMAWVFTALCAIALVAMVGLIAYARELQAQATRWAPSPVGADGREELEELQAYEGYEGYGASGTYLGAAESGYPGAWDEVDEDDFPRQAVAGH
jgi:hypothetical protein